MRSILPKRTLLFSPPERIEIGSAVLIDDYAVLDARGGDERQILLGRQVCIGRG